MSEYTHLKLAEHNNRFFVRLCDSQPKILFGDLNLYDLFVDAESFDVMREKSVVKMKISPVRFVVVGSGDLERMDPNLEVKQVVTN